MSSTLDLEYKSNLVSSEQAIDEINRLLDSEKVSSQERFPFILAISEAFTNAVVHGNEKNPDKKVKVKISVDELVMSADIIDEGRGGLDRISQKKPSTPQDEGGRGIDLIEHYSTSVGYVQIPAGGLKVEIRIERRPIVEHKN
jgi:anti-sigma regulatory factor (Ser/Thr protein kinase)